jgi:hypothetical protein
MATIMVMVLITVLILLMMVVMAVMMVKFIRNYFWVHWLTRENFVSIFRLLEREYLSLRMLQYWPIEIQVGLYFLDPLKKGKAIPVRCRGGP